MSGFPVSDYAWSKAFYRQLHADDGDRGAVDAFHKAALAAGGKDNGAPGLRPQYGPGY